MTKIERQRELLTKKKLLREVYRRWYELLCKERSARTSKIVEVEIGAGPGFLKEIVPEVVSTDILQTPSLDVVCNCLDLPFRDTSVNIFYMIDVFHHITDAHAALREFQRCLIPGGKIIMIEPANTFWGRFVWKYFHHEPFVSSQPSWALTAAGPRDSANIALPWIVFRRDRLKFEKEFPHLRIANYYTHTAMSYILSGGLKFPQLIPSFLIKPILAFDSFLCRRSSALGMFMCLTLERKVSQ